MILIIIILSLMLLFSVVINVYLLRNTTVLDGWSDTQMIDFAQSVTNLEVTILDLKDWCNLEELKDIKFSDN